LDGGWNGGVRLDLEVVLKSTENSAWKLLDILAESAAIKAPDIAADTQPARACPPRWTENAQAKKKRPEAHFFSLPTGTGR